MRRVLVVGATEPRVQRRELQIACLPWGKVGKGFTLADYDTLIIDLTSIEEMDAVDWQAFENSLNRETFI